MDGAKLESLMKMVEGARIELARPRPCEGLPGSLPAPRYFDVVHSARVELATSQLSAEGSTTELRMRRKDDGHVIAFTGGGMLHTIPIPGPGGLPPPPGGCAVGAGACSLKARRLRLSYNPFHDHRWHSGAPYVSGGADHRNRALSSGLVAIYAPKAVLASLTGFEPASTCLKGRGPNQLDDRDKDFFSNCSRHLSRVLQVGGADGARTRDLIRDRDAF